MLLRTFCWASQKSTKHQNKDETGWGRAETVQQVPRSFERVFSMGSFKNVEAN
jgi:hypothetical protein